MKPFPTDANLQSNCPHRESGVPCGCLYCARDLARARADWYRDEVVPLLRDARQMIDHAESGGWAELAARIDAALKACEGEQE